MHTFFINTSKSDFDQYEVLFDLYRESMELVSLRCPIGEWYSPEGGYAACAEQMARDIENYREINNSFHLIVYIDLCSVKEYVRLAKEDARKGMLYLRSLRAFYLHLVNESLVKLLKESGREPVGTLVMFGEDVSRDPDFEKVNSDGIRQEITRNLMRFWGVSPEEEQITRLASSVCEGEGSDEEKAGLLWEKLFAEKNEGSLPGGREAFEELIREWCGEIVGSRNVPLAFGHLAESLEINLKRDTEFDCLEWISCPYDSVAARVNDTVAALCRLNLCAHVIKCVEAKSIFAAQIPGEEREPLPFESYEGETLSCLLKRKRERFRRMEELLGDESRSFFDLGLVEALKSFSHEKFGLDEFGERSIELTERVISPEEEESSGEEESGEEQKEKESEAAEVIVIKANDRELEITAKPGEVLLKEEELPSFRGSFPQADENLRTTPNGYVEEAKKLRKHHLDFLKRVGAHVPQALSNYAGRSKENKPPLLQMGRARYAESAAGRETKPVERAKAVSESSYKSMMNQYLEFCAGRSVAITDIKEQCDWFVSRVRQIERSLKKLKAVALGMLIALLAVYVPYVVIQFPAITESLLSLTYALGSIGGPVVLLGVIYSVLAAMQKKKFAEAWAELLSKSDAVLAANNGAVNGYDKLLNTVIPALRFVYEYKLDASYCLECCEAMKAKREHHRSVLARRVRSIDLILGDLQCEEGGFEGEEKAEENALNCTVPFCSGEQNRSFYSVLDRKSLGFQK